MKKTIMLSLLPNEVIEIIAGFLDNFHTLQLSFTSKSLYNLLYSKCLQIQVDNTINSMKLVKQKALVYIRRINTDGVVYGECEQCFRRRLLYTHNNGYHERTICIEKCETYCIFCYNYITFHNTDKGCPICRQHLITTYYQDPSNFNQYLIRI